MIIRDQLDREIELRQILRRIISLVPSQTELVADLGLEKQLVGVTHFCVHPENIRKTCKRLGGTKKVNFRKVRELEPDIILCNKEENTREMVEELEKIAPVHISDVANLNDTYELMLQYGKLFDRGSLAQTMVDSIKKKAEGIRKMAARSGSRNVAYFIWNEPLMVAGKDTFIDEMLQLNNFRNVIEVERYPEISLKELEAKDIDICMLSSEPFPFKEEHKPEFQAFAKQVEIVDGEYFSWYGSRLIKAIEYFKKFH